MLGHSSRAGGGTTTPDPPLEHAPSCWVNNFVSCLETAALPGGVPVSCLDTAAVQVGETLPEPPPRVRLLVLGRTFISLFFNTTATQQASHRPISCQSCSKSRIETKVNGPHDGDSSLLKPTGSKSRQKPCQAQPIKGIGNLSASRRCLWV